MIRIATHFTDEQLKWLDQTAKTDGVPRSELIRRIMDQGIAARPKPEAKKKKAK